MKIPLDLEDFESTYEPPKKKSLKARFSHYFSLLGRILAIISIFFLIIVFLSLIKTYIQLILFWLEKQDGLVISITICLLFVIVSLPISVGYIILVLSTGYLFGVLRGLALVIFGVNFGLLIAHNILKAVGHHPSIYKLTQNDFAAAIMHVISGPLCFKIVFCSRLTPIPFGLQNTIFALSNVSSKIYHLASLLGLLPAQFIAVYVGSTLRSMQDVVDNNISSVTYIFATFQLIFGIILMICIGCKARTELMKALAEAETPASLNSSCSSMV